MTGEYFNARAGIKLGDVPTTGSAKVLQDIMSGNLHVYVDSLPGVSGALQSGEVKALAVASDKRLEACLTCRWSPKHCRVLGPRAGLFCWRRQRRRRRWSRSSARTCAPRCGATICEDASRSISTFPKPSSVEETNAFIKTEQDKWRPIVRQIGTE